MLATDFTILTPYLVTLFLTQIFKLQICFLCNNPISFVYLSYLYIKLCIRGDRKN